MSSLEAIAEALQQFRRNLLRCVLTMLGVFIGVAAVIAMLAVGAGAREQVLAQLRSLGSNLLLVWPGNLTAGAARLGAGTSPTLTIEDALAIEAEVPAVQSASPTLRASAQLVAGTSNWSSSVHGVVPSFLAARGWQIIAGRSFEPEEVRRSAQVVLLGSTVARNLFDDGDPVGQEIRIRNVPFVVTGVLARKGQSANGQDQDDVVMVPLGSAWHRVFGTNRANGRAVNSILVKIRDGHDMDAADEEVRQLLRRRHRLQPSQDDDFFTRNLSEIEEMRDAAARTLAVLLAAIAAVSLAVGGIGIMNVMLVSVTERTREIGIRIAVGARPGQVRSQFLIEAATLSLLGGTGGALVGIASATMIARVAGWHASIQVEAVLLAVAFSGVVGIAFGFYPAHRAARLDPIEALRHE